MSIALLLQWLLLWPTITIRYTRAFWVWVRLISLMRPLQIQTLCTNGLCRIISNLLLSSAWALMNMTLTSNSVSHRTRLSRTTLARPSQLTQSGTCLPHLYRPTSLHWLTRSPAPLSSIPTPSTWECLWPFSTSWTPPNTASFATTIPQMFWRDVGVRSRAIRWPPWLPLCNSPLVLAVRTLTSR